MKGWSDGQAGRVVKVNLLVGQQDQKDQLHHLYRGLPKLKCIVNSLV